MPVTKRQFQDAIAYLTSQGQLTVTYERVIEAGQQKVWDRQFNASGVMVSETDITPDEATLQQALTDLASEEADRQSLETVKVSIRSLKDTATANAPFIQSLAQWQLNADVNSHDTDTRFTALVATFAGQPPGVINAYKAGVLAEYGIDIDLIGVANLTIIHKHDILKFTRGFIAVWSIPLIA